MSGIEAGEIALPVDEPLEPRSYTAFVRRVRDARHRVVVSLGGGSVPGLAGNIALLRILEELDLREVVREVWGTSAGAAIGGPWASGTDARDILGHVMRLDRKGAVDINWRALAGAIMMKPFGRELPDGLIRGRQFSQTVTDALRCTTFEECRVPFRCIACSDDGKNRLKVFRRGPLEPAIFASMSLPGIVIPREPLAGEDHGYYDGGLVEKTPLLSPIAEHLRAGHEGRLLIIGTHFSTDAVQTRARGFLNRFIQTIHALEDLAWHYQLKEARAREDVELMLLNPHLQDPAMFDFSRVAENYRLARRAFQDTLSNARLALSFGLR